MLLSGVRIVFVCRRRHRRRRRRLRRRRIIRRRRFLFGESEIAFLTTLKGDKGFSFERCIGTLVGTCASLLIFNNKIMFFK